MSIPFVGAWYASSRGKDFWTWYFIGLFLPIISFIILLCLPDNKNPLEKELEQIRIKNKMLGLKNEVPKNESKFLKLLDKPCNNIQFEITEKQESNNRRIDVLIDKEPLKNILKEQDKKKRKFIFKKPSITEYTGLAPELVLSPSEHLLGKPQNQLKKRAIILKDAQSNHVIMVKVEMLRKYVIWHEFIKVDGTKQIGVYTKTGPFVFERWQYELALNDVSYRYKKMV